jgi:hypothetical protein
VSTDSNTAGAAPGLLSSIPSYTVSFRQSCVPPPL